MDPIPPPPPSPDALPPENAAPPVAPPTRPGAVGDADFTAHRFWRCAECGHANDVDRGAVRCPECGMDVAVMRTVRAYDDGWRSTRLPILIITAISYAAAVLAHVVGLLQGKFWLAPGIVLALPVFVSLLPRDTPRLVRALGGWAYAHVATVFVLVVATDLMPSIGRAQHLLQRPAVSQTIVTSAIVLGTLTAVRLTVRRGALSLTAAVALALCAIPLTAFEELIATTTLLTSSGAVIAGAVAMTAFMALTARHARSPRLRRVFVALGILIAAAYLIPVGTDTWLARPAVGPEPFSDPIVACTAIATLAALIGTALCVVCTSVLIMRLRTGRWRVEADAALRTRHDPATRPVVSTTRPAAAEDDRPSR